LPAEREHLPEIAVVISCHSTERLHLIDAAVRSAQLQTLSPAQVVVVVDHNPVLARRLVGRWPGVTVVENDRARGASDTRNTGASTATTEYVAFLDDDVCAQPEWLGHLAGAVGPAGVVGAGGRVVPDWTAPPWWFPEEFNWVVGATYSADQHHTVVRNVWAENMIVRTDDFRAVGGFRTSYGKVGDRSRPEDTDLCIRMSASGGHWIHVPEAVVVHHVPPTRATYRFFLRRCVDEGRGKAELAAILPRSSPVLTAERHYVRHTLPRGFATHLARGARRRRPDELVRAVNLVVGLWATVFGYAEQRLRGRGTILRDGSIAPPGIAEPVEAA
jgi:glycosyltransferase involved in cell wall biosynthesis